jgi:hypothetical protein
VNSLDAHHLSLAVIFDLQERQPFLLVDQLIFHAVVLLELEVEVSLLLIVLCPNDFCLFCFLFLRQKNRFLDLSLLILTLFVDHVVLL